MDTARDTFSAVSEYHPQETSYAKGTREVAEQLDRANAAVDLASFANNDNYEIRGKFGEAIRYSKARGSLGNNWDRADANGIKADNAPLSPKLSALFDQRNLPALLTTIKGEFAKSDYRAQGAQQLLNDLTLAYSEDLDVLRAAFKEHGIDHPITKTFNESEVKVSEAYYGHGYNATLSL